MKIGYFFKSCPMSVIVISVLLAACATDNTIAPDRPIQIETGLISGIAGVDQAVTVFKGIPFAAPPVGDLRWRAPQPPQAWKGVRKADEYCKSCIQALTRKYMPWTEEYMIGNEVDEDCLGLNVWTAAKTNEEKRPVLVYIHGGAYTGGSGEVLLYNGESLAKKGIVVVTVNYRVDIMGFFTHPELTKESPNNSSGNYGLLDHIAALKWVKQNISAFGGDPDNVTISGQSAGAASIHYLTASPLAKGLFHKAIAQSGPWSKNRSGLNLEEGEKKGIAFATEWDKQSLKELRVMDALDLLEKSSQDFGNRFLPIVDGWVLPKSVTEQYADGDQNDVPMLMGLNADERSSNATYGKISAEDFIANARNRYGEKADEYLTMYPASTDTVAGESQKQSFRDSGLANMGVWADFRSQTGSSKDFLYFFDRITPWPEFPQYGAFHSSEMPYVFNNQHLIDRPWESVDADLAEIMSSYWVNFITSGNPNGEGLPEWSSEKGRMMRLDEDPNMDVILSEEKMEFYQ